jgi:hypothetical protein
MSMNRKHVIIAAVIVLTVLASGGAWRYFRGASNPAEGSLCTKAQFGQVAVTPEGHPVACQNDMQWKTIQ